MKLLTGLILAIFALGCVDKDGTAEKYESNEDGNTFETDYPEVSKACAHMLECEYLNDGVDTNDCVEVQKEKYADIKFYCDSADEILLAYKVFWDCMSAASCDDLATDNVTCAEDNIVIRDLLRACGFDV